MPYSPEVLISRPLPAKLFVRIDATGEEFEPTLDDLAKFGLVSGSRVYARTRQMLLLALRDAGIDTDELTEARINPFRFLLEMVLTWPDVTDEDLTWTRKAIGAMEKALRDAGFNPDDIPDPDAEPDAEPGVEPGVG